MKIKSKIRTCASKILAQVCLIVAIIIASHCLRAQTNIITTICGQDTAGFSGDNGLAINATLNTPFCVQLDNHNNIFIVDALNHRIRKINASTGVIETIAGNGTAGYSGDGDLATNASLFVPEGIRIDSIGDIYIADGLNHRIRKIIASTGVITTIGGNGTMGYSGDGGLAVNAELNGPTDVCLDKSGNIYVADHYNNVVRKIDTSGIITTIAGTGSFGYSGDNGIAIDATFNGVGFLAVDNNNNLLITDASNNVLRKIDLSTGIITTFAGSGIAGYLGDGAAATDAQLKIPGGIYVEENGDVLFTEYGNGVVRKIDGSTGVISTVAGSGISGYSGDGGPALSAQLAPSFVCVGTEGDIYVADENNNRVRKIHNSVGIHSLLHSQNISIYPNPSTGKFTIETANYSSKDNLIICNAVGERVMQSTLNSSKSEIDLSGQPSGVYFAYLKSGDQSSVTKIVIANN